MKRLFRVILAILVLVVLTLQCSHAGLLYSKPAFKGRVIDAETKQPVEGVVVVVLYYKRSTFSMNVGGPNSFVTKARETLTDKKGEFHIPSYRELMLLNEDTGIEFTFFKPGYMSSGRPSNIDPTLVEKYFSAGEIGKEAEIETGSFDDSSYVKWKGPLGIMELKKTKPHESMSGSMPDDFGERDLPLLYKAIEEDDIIRGLLPKGGRKR